jgi:hypothetical protein
MATVLTARLYVARRRWPRCVRAAGVAMVCGWARWCWPRGAGGLGGRGRVPQGARGGAGGWVVGLGQRNAGPWATGRWGFASTPRGRIVSGTGPGGAGVARAAGGGRRCGLT